MGVCFDSNLTFRSCLETGEKALIPQLKIRMGALKFLGKWMSTKQRKKLAEALIMSKILYGIHVSGNMVSKTTIEI